MRPWLAFVLVVLTEEKEVMDDRDDVLFCEDALNISFSRRNNSFSFCRRSLSRNNKALSHCA